MDVFKIFLRPKIEIVKFKTLRPPGTLFTAKLFHTTKTNVPFPYTFSLTQFDSASQASAAGSFISVTASCSIVFY